LTQSPKTTQVSASTDDDDTCISLRATDPSINAEATQSQRTTSKTTQPPQTTESSDSV